MAYNPSIHTASNKAYGVTNKPVDARYWYYDSSTFSYRPYTDTAEVLSYLIANDRKGATVQIVTDEYWFKDGVADGDLVQKLSGVYVEPFIYNLPVGTATPIIIDFENSTIKKGAASAVSIGAVLANYRKNPEIKFEIITSANNTTPKDAAAWITNKEWADSYESLVEVTIYPDPDPEDPAVTADNINIIIKA